MCQVTDSCMLTVSAPPEQQEPFQPCVSLITDVFYPHISKYFEDFLRNFLILPISRPSLILDESKINSCKEQHSLVLQEKFLCLLDVCGRLHILLTCLTMSHLSYCIRSFARGGWHFCIAEPMNQGGLGPWYCHIP